MAIWQVNFNLVFKNNGDKFNINVKLKTKAIEKNLKIEKSWSENIIQYGKLDSTCIEIYTEECIKEISVRLDLRNVNSEQLKAISDFAHENNLCILYNNTIYPYTTENIFTIIECSEAKRFLENPTEFLDKK